MVFHIGLTLSSTGENLDCLQEKLEFSEFRWQPGKKREPKKFWQLMHNRIAFSVCLGHILFQLGVGTGKRQFVKYRAEKCLLKANEWFYIQLLFQKANLWW